MNLSNGQLLIDNKGTLEVGQINSYTRTGQLIQSIDQSNDTPQSKYTIENIRLPEGELFIVQY